VKGEPHNEVIVDQTASGRKWEKSNGDCRDQGHSDVHWLDVANRRDFRLLQDAQQFS